MEDRKPIIALFVCILLLGISNITNVAVSKAQKEQIKNLEIKVTEINDEKEEYREEVKNLEKQLKLIENNVNDVKKQTDQIADKLVEVKSREDTQEELKTSTEELSSEKPIEVKSVPVEEVTTEEITTEKVTTEEEIAEEYTLTEVTNTEAQNTDVPWVVYEVVECEVHGGDKESKMHVAHVIRNRVNSDLFPNNYYDVCTSPYQFGMRSDVEESTIDAVNEAMATGDTTGGALFFHSMGYSDSFNGYGYIFTDNVGHHFYGN